MFSKLIRFVLLVAALGALATSAPAQGERRWKDAELAPLAKSLGAYLEARDSALGIKKAKSDLVKSVEALRRASDGVDRLRRPADLQRALVLSRDIARLTVNKGKVSQDSFTDCSLDGKGLDYAYLLPKDYDASKKSYPLLL